MNIFLLRWNPNVSSFKDETFRQMIADSREGPVAMDWSVREWEKLEAWDWAVLCRVGTDADGIVAIGRFDGRVEEADSWRKDGSKCPSWTSSRTEVLRGNFLEDSPERGRSSSGPPGIRRRADRSNCPRTVLRRLSPPPASTPSFLVPEALAKLRSFRDRAADAATRKAAEKVLPVFEKAAELRMPVSFQL